MALTYEKRGYLLEDYRCFHLSDPAGPEVDYHYHEFHKLIYLRSGRGFYTVEGRRYRIEAGDLIFVGRGSVHRPELEGGIPYERYIFYLSADYLRRESDESLQLEDLFSGDCGHVLRPSRTVEKRLCEVLSSICEETYGAEPGARILGRAKLLALLVELRRTQLNDGSSQPLTAEPGDEKIQSILDYINENITDPLSIDELSERFFISKYHMMRRFREETGLPIHAYIADKRLFLARDLIASGLSATDACYKSGYQSYSSFSRAYRKRFSSTPTGRVAVYAENINE